MLQRYTFGSKSQRIHIKTEIFVVLLMMLQRYTFGSKSQQVTENL